MVYDKFQNKLGSYNVVPEDLSHRQPGQPFWAGGPQPVDPTPWANLGTFAAGVGAVVGLGMMPYGNRGRRGVDLYYQIAKKVEDFSPGKIFRTFAISDTLFPFTAQSGINIGSMGIPPSGKITQALGAIYGKDRIKRYAIDPHSGLKRVITEADEIAQNIKRNSLHAEFLLDNKKVLGRQLSPRTQRLIAISRAYASSQVQRFNSLLDEFRTTFTDRIWRGFIPREYDIGKTPFRYSVKARDYLVGRLDRLGLTLPKRILGVKQGPALRMLGGITMKGAAAALAIHGLNYLDYLRREEDNRALTTLGGGVAGAAYGSAIFRTLGGAKAGGLIGAAIGLLPMFDEGIYAGFAGLYTKGRLLHAKFSDYIGLTESAREQEELAPGITQLKTPLGFALGGGLAASIFLKPTVKSFSRFAFLKGAYTGAGIYGALAMGAAFLSGSILPGLFGSEHTYEELKDIYSGEKQVPIRKGRWWEFGRTPWEGTKVDYYRMHWYPRLMSRAKDISLYGSEEEKWQYDPVLHPIKATFDEEFKYHRELRNYRSRPYPVTGTYFEDVPFLGPILAGTLGKLIKPSRYMHTEKWLQQGPGGEAEYQYIPHGGEHEPVYELGGLKPGAPIGKYDVTGIIGEQIYRLNEMRGLTGFMHGSIKEALTGSQDYFDDQIRLQSSSRAYGAERAYWDLNLGGLLGTTEAFRRYLPHRRRQIEQYNPIPNQMPSWLPGSNYYIDFKHGDPFIKVPEGELRLPGRGYVSLHPELEGIHPEAYPLMHRFRILADVAMWSEEFKEARAQMQLAKRRGELTIQEQSQMKEILQQVSQRKKKKDFKDYKFAVDDAVKVEVTIDKRIGLGKFTTTEFGDVQLNLAGLNISQASIDRLSRTRQDDGSLKDRREGIQTELNDIMSNVFVPGATVQVLIPRDPLNRYKLGKRNISMPVVVYDAHGVNLNRDLLEKNLAERKEGALSQYVEYSPAQRLFGTAWEILTHKGELPTEYLTPLAPFAKYVHARSAIEEYERTRVFGTESAFWQHPIEHFLKPFGRSMRSLVDESYIPEEIQQRRELQEYFDKIKYVKYSRLANLADQVGYQELKDEALKIRKQTLFGLDPYGSFRDILKALPGPERDFFTAFSNAKSPEERARILQLLPENERSIYIARWQGQLSRQLVAEHRAGLSKDALGLLREISTLKRTEGRPWSAELDARYKKEAKEGETYADWHRREELNTYFSKMPLPPPEWIGWHPKVDLEDIKLKVVENLGEDMHDYGLWQSRARTLPRKPYIDEATINAMFEPPAIDRGEVAVRLREVLKGYGIEDIQITSHYLHQLNQENLVDLELSKDHTQELQNYIDNPDRISV